MYVFIWKEQGIIIIVCIYLCNIKYNEPIHYTTDAMIILLKYDIDTIVTSSKMYIT